MRLLAALVIAMPALAALREQRIPLAPGWTSGHAWWIFETPAPLPGLPEPHMTHIRLMAAPGTALWLNGAAIRLSAEGEAEIGRELRWKGNRRNLLIADPATAVTVSLTTRVFLSRLDLARRGGELHGRVWVRNTLENTSNVFVTIRGDRVLFDLPATVPPGVTQPVEVRLALPDPLPATLECILDKHEEAVEPGYQYAVSIPVASLVKPPY